MISKINVTNIFKDHISTLKDYHTGKYLKSDFILFFAVPLVVAILVFIFLGEISDTAVVVLATSLSIFAALLFNLLLLVYDSIRKEEKQSIEDKPRLLLLKQIFYNISFGILISVLTIILLILFSQNLYFCILQKIISFLAYYLITLFILTLLMILKRTHILISGEFKK